MFDGPTLQHAAHDASEPDAQSAVIEPTPPENVLDELASRTLFVVEDEDPFAWEILGRILPTTAEDALLKMPEE